MNAVKRSYLCGVLTLTVMIGAHSIRHESGHDQSRTASTLSTNFRRPVPLFLFPSLSRSQEGILDRSLCRPRKGQLKVSTYKPKKILSSGHLDLKHRALRCLATSEDLTPEPDDTQTSQASESDISKDEAYNRGVSGREMDPLHRPVIEKLREVRTFLPVNE